MESPIERTPPQDLDAERATLGGMLLSKDAISDVVRVLGSGGTAFYRPAHETIYQATLAVHARGEETPDPLTVADELVRTGELTKVGGNGYLMSLVQAVPTAANAEYYALIVADRAVRRHGIEESTRTIQSLYVANGDTNTLVEDGVERMREVRDRGLVAAEQPLLSLGEFLDQADDEPEWVIPGVLARWDRMILTAGEGGGKSLFNRQMLMRTAAGLHPWQKAKIKPQRALLVDVENSASQVRPWMRKMWRAAESEGADASALDRLIVEVVEGGLDLHHPGDRSRLLRIVEKAKPDIIAIGPLYKLASGNPNDEETARVLMSALEAIRVASNGAAMLIEAHAPHQQAGVRRRDLRPIGSSLWLRWPEFGFGLSPVPASTEEGAEEIGLADWVPWRGARAERSWPDRWMHGATWPWQPASVEHSGPVGSITY